MSEIIFSLLMSDKFALFSNIIASISRVTH